MYAFSCLSPSNQLISLSGPDGSKKETFTVMHDVNLKNTLQKCLVTSLHLHQGRIREDTGMYVHEKPEMSALTRTDEVMFDSNLPSPCPRVSTLKPVVSFSLFQVMKVQISCFVSFPSSPACRTTHTLCVCMCLVIGESAESGVNSNNHGGKDTIK